MSYDLNVWLREGDTLDPVFKDIGLTGADGAYRKEGRAWVLNVSLDPIEPEDIPDAVFSQIAGLTFLAHLTLEPSSAPQSAHSLARKAARALAEAGVGCVEDPQTGKVTLARSAKALRTEQDPLRETAKGPGLMSRLLRRKAPADETPRVSEVELSWWVAHDKLSRRRGLERLLSAITRHLPEALPRRYGPYEPPSFKFADTGPDHFIDFLLSESFATVYPTRPCTGASYPVGQDTPGWTKRGPDTAYRAGHVSFEFDAAVLDNPDWRIRLVQAWKVLTEVIQPFYGDVRILSDRIAGRGTMYFDARSEAHPVHGPWWRGIPASPASARVIGPPYLPYWPDTGAPTKSGFVFLNSADWRLPDKAANNVPIELAQPEKDSTQPSTLVDLARRHAEGYPPVFPFKGSSD